MDMAEQHCWLLTQEIFPAGRSATSQPCTLVARGKPRKSKSLLHRSFPSCPSKQVQQAGARQGKAPVCTEPPAQLRAQAASSRARVPRGAPKSAVLPAAGSARALQPPPCSGYLGYSQVFTVPDSACCIAQDQTVMQGFPNKLRRNLYNILHRHVVGICHIFVLFCSFFVLFLVSFYFFPPWKYAGSHGNNDVMGMDRAR